MALVHEGLDQLVPVGLILGEAVTNSLKHGFAGRGSGGVEVELAEDGADYVLTMRDDGVGVPPGLDATSGSSLGLRLVVMLSAQLKGSWRIERRKTGGTEVSVRLPSQSREQK